MEEITETDDLTSQEAVSGLPEGHKSPMMIDREGTSGGLGVRSSNTPDISNFSDESTPETPPRTPSPISETVDITADKRDREEEVEGDLEDTDEEEVTQQSTKRRRTLSTRTRVERQSTTKSTPTT